MTAISKNTDRRQPDAMRWVLPLVQGLILATLLGGYQEMSSLRIEVTILQERISTGMADRFTGKDGEYLESRIMLLESDNRSTENRLDYIERFIPCTEPDHKIGDN